MNGNRLLYFLVFWALIIGFNIVFADYPVTFTDAMGREITLDKPAESIAEQAWGVAEALKIVGAWDKVVAKDGYISDPQFYPNVEKIPNISPYNSFDLDYEKIMEINPDVMIIENRDYGKETLNQDIEMLEPEVKVIVLEFTNPYTMAENFEKLGYITGNSEKAKEYGDYYTGIVTPIIEKTSMLSETEKPNVFIKAAGYTADQMCTYGSEMEGWNNMMKICGGKNVASDLPFAFGDFDKEWLVDSDIDVFIDDIWDVYYPETFGYHATNPSQSREKGQEMIDEIKNNELFSGTDAVKNNRVYLQNCDLSGTIRQVILIPYLAKWLHPELFGDLNPEEIHQEYLNRFIGADYNLNDVGLFAYP